MPRANTMLPLEERPLLMGALLVLGACTVLRAAEPLVPPDQGSIGASGKFIPAGKPRPAAAEQDLAKRLAELGAAVEGEKLKLGQVEIDRAARTLSFPAKINALDGAIEYAVVTDNGKVHESLLSTTALPLDIHLGCLLLGGGEPGKRPAEIRIEVSWETNGPRKVLPLEDLIVFAKDHPQGSQGGGLSPGAWTYSGSMIDAGGFAAAREGSIVALIRDEAALVNNPRPGHEDDSLHVPNRRALPPVGAPVRVTFQPVISFPEKPTSIEQP